MPRHIIACTGHMDVNIWLKTFLARNHEPLSEIGVLAAGKRDVQSIAHADDYTNALGDDPSAYTHLLRSWAGLHNAHTWILPLFQYYFEPESFLETLALCRACFPQAKITWVHGLTPPVPRYCMRDSVRCFRDRAHPMPGWLDRHLRFTASHDTLLDAIRHPGRPGPDALVLAQGAEPRSVVVRMLSLAGMDLDGGTGRNLILAPPALRAPLARDTRAYVLTLKNLFLRFGQPVFSWDDEKGVLQGGEDHACVFSPEECVAITQVTRPGYETVARHHNLPLLPDYVPDPHWPSFSGLRREHVCRLIELHSPACAASIREFLAGLNPRLLTTYECEIFADFLPRQGIFVPAATSGPTNNGHTAPRLEEGETYRPKVSVLTPTYNHAAFIRDCIEGVLAQRTSFSLEHVIADDGSSDGTREIILDYALRHPHIVPVMHQYHLGGYANHRDLFQMARAPYVAPCDGDDYFTDPLKLQTQADLLDARPGLALCFHLTRVSYQDASREDWVYPEPEMLPGGVRPRYSLPDLMACNLMQTSSVMYRWRFGPVLPDWFILATLPSDWYLHLLHAEQGDIGFIDKVMSVYRRHKQATYYTVEESRLEHRHKHGLNELYTYDVVNKHFNGKYTAILRDLAGGVFADLIQDAANSNDNSVLTEALRAYPEFAAYALKRMGIQTPSARADQH